MAQDQDQQNGGTSSDKTGATYNPPMPDYPDILVKKSSAPHVPLVAGTDKGEPEDLEDVLHRVRIFSFVLALLALILLFIPGYYVAIGFAVAAVTLIVRTILSLRRRPGIAIELAMLISVGVIAFMLWRIF